MAPETYLWKLKNWKILRSQNLKGLSIRVITHSIKRTPKNPTLIRVGWWQKSIHTEANLKILAVGFFLAWYTSYTIVILVWYTSYTIHIKLTSNYIMFSFSGYYSKKLKLLNRRVLIGAEVLKVFPKTKFVEVERLFGTKRVVPKIMSNVSNFKFYSQKSTNLVQNGFNTKYYEHNTFHWVFDVLQVLCIFKALIQTGSFLSRINISSADALKAFQKF